MFFNLLYDLGGLNRTVFYAINGVHGPYLDAFMLAGTRVGDVWNAAWLAALMFSLILARRAMPGHASKFWTPQPGLLVHFLFSCAIAGALVWGAKTGFNMPRPFDTLPAGTVTSLTILKDPYSFPSGHSAFAMLVACVFWPTLTRAWKAVFGAAVVWVAMSRVSVGAHFPVDVIAGLLCGAASAWLAVKIIKRGSYAKKRI